MSLINYKSQITKTFVGIREDFKNKLHLMSKQETSCYYTISTQSILLEKDIFTGQFINDKKFKDILHNLEVMNDFKEKQLKDDKMSQELENLEEKDQLGTKINTNFTPNDDNLTNSNKIKFVENKLEHLTEVQEFLDNILEGTPEEGVSWVASAVKNLMSPNGMDGWSKEEVDEIYSQIPDDETLTELTTLLPDNLQGTTTEPNDRGEVAFNREADIDYESNNYKSLGHAISDIADLYESARAVLKDISPRIEDKLEMNGYVMEDIGTATAPQNGFAMKLNDMPTDDSVSFVTQNAPDISIMEKDDSYYIASNSSEFDIVQAAYAYLQIDGDIPENLSKDIDMSKLNSNHGLSEEATSDLKTYVNDKKIQEDEEVANELKKFNEEKESLQKQETSQQETLK